MKPLLAVPKHSSPKRRLPAKRAPSVRGGRNPISCQMWYRTPAGKWIQALPLGNGRFGAMVYGGVPRERIDLSEVTCVSGEASHDNTPQGSAALMVMARQALFAGDYAQAEKLCHGMIGRKLNYGTNIPFGHLLLSFRHGHAGITGYRRCLDLANALTTVDYQANGVAYHREIFISAPHQALVMRITCAKTGTLDFSVTCDGGDNPFNVRTDAQGDLLLDGKAHEKIHSDGKTGVSYCGRMRVITTGGKAVYADGAIRVEGTRAAVIIVAAATDFANGDPSGDCRKRVATAARLGYDSLFNAHVAEYRGLFSRVKFRLGDEDTADIPTDEMLAAVKNGETDLSLTALMFQYGRYLLIASSRPDSPLPAHLQGAWNDNIVCRMGWTCDMHLDINTQMNYWPAEVANLSECALPLFSWVAKTLMPSGRRTALQAYGLPGWVAHTVANAWGFSAPGWSSYWGFHPTGGAWIATHLWDHYLYTGDTNFLREHAYPVLEEAARFFAGYLTEDPANGYLVSGPSISPENCFVYRDGKKYTNSMGPTCDTLLIREVFHAFLEAARALDKGADDLTNAVAAALKRLPPFKIGKHGQLQEWFDDFTEALPNHRHTSHLLAVFPFAQITPDETPELAAAARVSIDRRYQAKDGFEDTGWARSLLILYSARLWDAQAVAEHIRLMQRTLTNDNLMVFHPPVAGAPSNVYELDGNTGLCAGIAETLLQSVNGRIRLLPALPKSWRNGKIEGLCARGGLRIDMEWKEGRLWRAVITATRGGTADVRYGRARIALALAPRESVTLGGDLERV